VQLIRNRKALSLFGGFRFRHIRQSLHGVAQIVCGKMRVLGGGGTRIARRIASSNLSARFS
jgi:hypothetical protein